MLWKRVGSIGVWCLITILAAVRSSTPNISSTSPDGCMLRNTSRGVKAYCSHLHLTSVPKNLPADTISLDLSYNNITALRDDDFLGIPLLIALNLYHNQIASIQNETFKTLKSLRTLSITKNKLNHLDASIFSNNSLISSLQLDSNEFTAIPHAALTALPRISEVSLFNNTIQSLDFHGFSMWSHLYLIELTQNDVHNISQEDFQPLENTSVTVLTLISNEIGFLPPHVFSHLKSIKHLRIDSNKLYSFDVQPFLGMTTPEELSVSGCQVHRLQVAPPNDSLSQARDYPKVNYLNLARNVIKSVPKGSFWGFESLQVLNLEWNKILEVTNKSFCLLLSLKELNLMNNQLQFLPQEAFACMPSLQRLNISGNHLASLLATSFNGMPSILSLAVSNNLISYCNDQLWSLNTLQMLDLSHNLLSHFTKYCFIGLPYLQVLNISYNNIVYYSKESFTKLARLQQLYLTFQKTNYLNGVFQQLKSLEFLDLSDSSTIIESQHQFTNASSLGDLHFARARLRDSDLFDTKLNLSLFDGLTALEKLHLQGNILRNPDSRVFQNLPNLYHLDLTSSGLQILQSGIFTNLSHLTNLFLSANKLLELPEFVFTWNTNLQVLYLQNNTLKNLRKNTFAGIQNLHQLYLPGNQINTIVPGTILPSNTSLILDISRNPFSCTCSLEWFRQWLENANINFKHPNQTICSTTSIKSLINQPILSFQPDKSCGLPITLIVSILLAFFSVILIGVLGYRKRWWLNYKCFLLQLCVFGYEEVIEEFNEEDYEHQLNLMFHPADEMWVDQFMKPAVEERLPHLQRIIYGDNDLNPGMFYINAIHHAIENSYKTVLLLSNRCVDDAWFMMKVRMALEHLNDTRMDKILLVFLEDIGDDNMPYLVRLFLSRNKTYMLWTEDEDGQELFWAQFDKSMRANRMINNTIPI